MQFYIPTNSAHSYQYECACSLTLLPIIIIIIICFLGPYPWHMEVPRLGVESELQLPTYTTATAMQDLNCVCNPHCSSWQPWILNPLSDAREQIHILMNTSTVCYC